MALGGTMIKSKFLLLLLIFIEIATAEIDYIEEKNTSNQISFVGDIDEETKQLMIVGCILYENDQFIWEPAK